MIRGLHPLVVSTKAYSLHEDCKYIIHGSFNRTIHNKKLALERLRPLHLIIKMIINDPKNPTGKWFKILLILISTFLFLRFVLWLSL